MEINKVICDSFVDGYNRGKEDMLVKACEWMEKTFFDICDLSKRSDNIQVVSKHKGKRDLIENFKRTMEEQL